MNSPFSITFARVFMILICVLVGVSIDAGIRGEIWLGILGGSAFGAAIILVEMAIKDFTFKAFSSAAIGLLVGILCAWLVTRIDFFATPWMNKYDEVTVATAKAIFELSAYTGLGFLGMMLALRSDREEFSFIIPYVRFRQEAVQGQPILVDTNVIIDGRIPRICATGFLSGTLIVPRFVLDELHILADNRDEIKKERGKRGLECLNKMKQTPGLEVTVSEALQESREPVDTKMIRLGRILGARILTNDANLGKVARLQGVAVLSLIELAKAMRPVVVPGDDIELALVKEGKDPHQAVGYLADGTMIVVNHASQLVGTSQEVTVAGALQTSAGRLIFAELKGQGSTNDAESPDPEKADAKAHAEATPAKE